MIAALLIAAGVTFFAGLCLGSWLAAPHVRAIDRQPWEQIEVSRSFPQRSLRDRGMP